MAATLDNTADGTAGIVLERPCNSSPNHPTDVTAQSPAAACGTHAPGLAAELAMKPSPEKSPQEVLAGFVERVTYHNVENGFGVLRAKARANAFLAVAILTQALRLIFCAPVLYIGCTPTLPPAKRKLTPFLGVAHQGAASI